MIGRLHHPKQANRAAEFRGFAADVEAKPFSQRNYGVRMPTADF
jgi:hypothetical protein